VYEKEWLANGPLVSIIVPTFNSEETIARCLQSIKDQTYSNIEVVVVDRYSSDKTVIIAEKFNARVFLRDSERSAARNYGVVNARGLFIFFVDSDMELTPRVIEECITMCLRKDVDAVIIPETSIAKGFLSECRKMEKKLYIEDKFFEVPRFFRRDVIQKVGGYDESLIFGEDSDLYVRIQNAGYKTCKIQAKTMHYEGELSMKEIVLKAYHYGKNLPLFVKKNPSLVVKKHLPIRPIYVRNIKLLFKDPAYLIGLIFVKLIEYEAYLTGIFQTLLRKICYKG